LVSYTTAGSTDAYSISPLMTNGAITADNLAAGSDLTAASASNWNWRNWNTESTSFDEAVAAKDFWTWGFEVTGAVAIDLLDFDIRLDRTGTGPDDIEIRARVNGGASLSLLTHDYQDSASGVDFTNVSLASIPALSMGDSIVFTLAAFNSKSGSGTFDLENFSSENYGLAIYGDITTSAIPEPSTAIGMITLLGFAVLLVRRRRD